MCPLAICFSSLYHIHTTISSLQAHRFSPKRYHSKKTSTPNHSNTASFTHHFHHSKTSVTMSLSLSAFPWSPTFLQGRSNPGRTAVPAGIASSLESALPCTTISCSQCQQPVVPAGPGSVRDFFIGKTKWLRRIKDLPLDSVARHPDSNVNEGAGNHHCVEVMASTCGCLVFCMPMTSFNGRGIIEKYALACNAREYYEAYMPLDQGNTPATHSAGLLEYGGDHMPQHSYVHLEFGYWIERKNLGAQGTTRLTPQALETVKQAYATAEIARQRDGWSRVKAWLARRSASPPSPPSQPRPWQPPTPSPSPTRAIVTFASPRWGPASPPPSPPPFVLLSRCNTAIGTSAPPSPEKREAMGRSWR